MVRCENCGVELDEGEAVEGLLGETLCPDCAEEEDEDDLFDYMVLLDQEDDA